MAAAQVVKGEAESPPRRTREEVPFTWYVTCGMPTYSALADVRFDRTFLDPEALIEAYSVGYPRALEMFGPDVRYSGPGWSGISYGHVNCLGSKLSFPEDSEVGRRRDDAILPRFVAEAQGCFS